MMTTKEITNQLESYAVSSGYPFQLFYQDGWQFVATQVEQGLSIHLRYLAAANQYGKSSECLISTPTQATLIRLAIELMREATGDTSSIKTFDSAKNLARSLEGYVDRAFPGRNYAFGYFYHEAWSFEGEDMLEGYKVWLNFQFDITTWKQTSRYVLPSALTTRELTGWTKTFMNEAFSKR